MTGERRYHLTLEEQCRMFKLLATMMGAAIGLSESFFLLESGEDSPRRSYVFLKIHIHLSQGHSLSSSLAKASNSFSPKVIAMIRLGEETGALARCIEALAADLEAEWNAVLNGALDRFLEKVPKLDREGAGKIVAAVAKQYRRDTSGRLAFAQAESDRTQK